LTETSAGSGSTLIATTLESRGYSVTWRQPVSDRGVMLASRVPVKSQLCSDLDVTLPWRVAGVQLAVEPTVAVLGIYVPSRDRSPANVAKKTRFIESFLTALEQLAPETR
jgi:exodeoxyribonuclease-3